MKRSIFSLIAFSTLSFFHCTANSSLLVNGSFEQVTFSDNSSVTGLIHNHDLSTYPNKNRAWDVFFDLPGWSTIFGNGIELQRNIVATPQHGSHHVELDSHRKVGANSAMNQSLSSLITGDDYLLSFYYKPRTNTTNDNGIKVFWYDDTVTFAPTMTPSLIVDSTKKLSSSWTLQSVLLTADATQMNLSFAAFGKENTLGGLIDNISLVKVNETSQLSIIAIFSFIAGLVVYRQRKLSLKHTFK